MGPLVALVATDQNPALPLNDMKHFHSRTPQLLFILLSLSLPLANVETHATLVQQTSRINARPALVLVVSHADPDEQQSNVDAVVLVENGKFKQPYLEENEAAQKQFASNYFAPGKKYRVTFGGGEVGTATIKSSGMGCNNIHAAATLEDNKRIPPHLSALATDSRTLGKKPAARRAPTDAEREGVMRIVRQIYTARGTTAKALNTLKTTNLTATDLNGDGQFELIGSFVLEIKRGNTVSARRDLFLIAEPQRPPGPTPIKAAGSAGPSSAGRSSAGPSSAGPSSAGRSSAGSSSARPSSAGRSSAGPSSAGSSPAGVSSAGPSVSAEASFSAGPPFKATLIDFQSYNLPPEGFDSAVDFVDQLDLDADGISEVFAQQHGFDAYGYSIYKKTARGWRKVYTTTGDAC